MTTILDTILDQKRREVQELKEISFSLDSQYSIHAEKKRLSERLKDDQQITIISEIKRASPSAGRIATQVDIMQQAKMYEQLGAGAISVLTDTPFFKGSFTDLQDIRSITNVPLLCKDFIIDEIQIEYAKYMGADVVLLIVAALSPAQLQNLYQKAIQLDLEIIVEVHDEQELERAFDIAPQIIGINNRNLKTFEVDVTTTERLAKRLQGSSTLMISESGIRTREDVLRVKKAGVQGILVGEALMRSSSLEETFSHFQV
ncbi:indole-3-glycerol phosphate synthase TrpC [Risungbinella massiliensis]|uniref:indole-3-glycerol phosphate synthase TrpC n=1 Tax=Risungbinella massiliensis TaxID=1329796 RepID=UPI0005CC3130|nr:indole-3-glycerol phosphate synthase TrpC [Risungbinella massiliensis]